MADRLTDGPAREADQYSFDERDALVECWVAARSKHPGTHTEIAAAVADLVRRALAAVPRLAHPEGERGVELGYVLLNPDGERDFRSRFRHVEDGAWSDLGSRWGSRSETTKAAMIEEFEAEGYRVVPARLINSAPLAAREDSDG